MVVIRLFRLKMVKLVDYLLFYSKKEDISEERRFLEKNVIGAILQGRSYWQAFIKMLTKALFKTVAIYVGSIEFISQ